MNLDRTADPARVLVLGTGALGCLFAARLSRQEVDVTVAGTWREGLEAIGRAITVTESGGTWTTHVSRALQLSEIDSTYDLVLVLTKSRRTAGVAGPAARAVADDGLILSLQNGLGNREILSAAATDLRVAAGVTAVGGTLLGPGRVRCGGLGLSSIGDDGPRRARLEAAARLLGDAGFPVELTPDLERVIWTKLAVNCAINPASALSGLPNGQLADRTAWRRQLEAAALEVGRVAAARGVDLGVDLGHHAVSVARATAANRSSMLQDVTARRPTEIESMCAAVAREGRRLGVPTPINQRLADRIRTLEAAWIDPQPVAPAARLEPREDRP